MTHYTPMHGREDALPTIMYRLKKETKLDAIERNTFVQLCQQKLPGPISETTGELMSPSELNYWRHFQRSLFSGVSARTLLKYYNTVYVVEVE